MKITELRDAIRKADDSQLREMLAGVRKQLFTMKVNSATSHVKDYSLFRKLRGSVARILTELQARQENGTSTN